MAKTLILYYSRTGTTAIVAEAMTKVLNADIAEIKCHRYDPGWFRYLLAGYDSVKGHLPSVDSPEIDLDNYDLVILGAPIWTSYPALPLHSYLSRNPNLPDRVALFLTSGGHSVPEKAVKIVDELLQSNLVATLALQQDKVTGDDFSEELDAFISRVNSIA